MNHSMHYSNDRGKQRKGIEISPGFRMGFVEHLTCVLSLEG